jgi:site-specific recombinase XerD
MGKTIAEVPQLALEEVKRLGYSEITQSEIRLDFEGIVNLHEFYAKSEIDKSVIDEYLQSVKTLYNSKLICKERYYKRLRNIERLILFAKNEVWVYTQIRPRATVDPYYDGIISLTLENDHRSEETKRSMKFALLNHFAWLKASGIANLSDVNEVLIKEYIESMMQSYTASTTGAVKGNLKRAYSFLCEEGLSPKDFEGILSLPVCARNKPKMPIPHSEIAATLLDIDRSKPIGKRDYAMILLATVTGMRAVDVAALKLCDIDWAKGEIRITQSKTGNTLLLPLTADVGEGVKDYILSGRPKSVEEEIFLRFSPPYNKIKSTGVTAAHSNRRRAAGLGPIGFHSLRRSLGRAMVQAGVEIEKAAQVFGDKCEVSLNPYISLDEVNLKKCSLDFTGIEIAGRYSQ